MSTKTGIHHVGIGNILETRSLAVPTNQRSYSWTDREIDDLWTDLKWAISENEKEYFLGTVVLTLAESEKPLVVDGQQRLASVSMIYAAMRDHLLAIGETEIAADLETFLINTDRWTRIRSAKLELSAQDALFFEHHVLAQPSAEERTKAQPTKTSPDSHKRIAKAFAKLSQAVSELLKGAPEPLTILNRWDQFLRTSAKVIVLEVEDESSAFQIFETLNDRGLDLAVTDLLKNYLLGKAGKSGLESVRHHWLTAMSRVGDGDERVFKRFIHHFWSSIHGHTREKLLYKSIKDKIKTPSRALELAANLAGSAGSYAAIINSDHEIWAPTGTAGRRAISTLKDLKLEQYKPLLLACMDTVGLSHPDELTRLLRALVSWSVRFRVTQQLGSSRLEDFYGNGGKQVREAKMRKADEIINALKDKVPSDAAFIKGFEEFREESGRIARYYLIELEKTARQQKGIKESVESDEQVINLEHILPKEPDLRVWKEFNEESAPVYVFRLGNQTLLSKAENEKLGNGAFRKKREFFAKSSIEITKSINSRGEWTEQAIDERQRFLAKLAAVAWPINGKTG
jgi:hypothetical protein